jgi:hypothetical protein
VTELEQLKQRRELVVLAAELQRATVIRRLERIEANPARRWVGYAAAVLKRPAMLSIGTAAINLAIRTIKRRRATRVAYR